MSKFNPMDNGTHRDLALAASIGGLVGAVGYHLLSRACSSSSSACASTPGLLCSLLNAVTRCCPGNGGKSTAKGYAAGDGGVGADNPYESVRDLDVYLMMHYGTRQELLPYTEGGAPAASLEFPRRCADVCAEMVKTMKTTTPTRVLDVGCSVGRSSFELARSFDEVIGIDYSQSFINAANELKANGSMPYKLATEGVLHVPATATVDASLDRTRVTFQHGNACDIDAALGTFDVVLAANLLCRLPLPRLFLARCASLIRPGGYLVMPSPYTWLEQYTKQSEWIGGYVDAATGCEVKSFDGIRAALEEHFELVRHEDMFFFIKETVRKHQWTASDLTVWRRKA